MEQGTIKTAYGKGVIKTTYGARSYQDNLQSKELSRLPMEQGIINLLTEQEIVKTTYGARNYQDNLWTKQLARHLVFITLEICAGVRNPSYRIRCF
jgi:hypothetical protein